MVYFNNLLSDLDDLDAATVNVNALEVLKIESGALDGFTRISCPGKYLGRLIEILERKI